MIAQNLLLEGKAIQPCNALVSNERKAGIVECSDYTARSESRISHGQNSA